MRSNRKFLMLGLMVAALFLLGAATVSAAGPETGIQPYEIKLVVDEQGGWAIPSLGGLDLGLNSATFESVAKTLGLQMQVPRLDPALVKMAMDNNIQTIALIKEGEVNTILVNNQPATAITLSDAALDLVAGFVPDLETLIGGLNRTYVAVGVQLPVKEGTPIALDLGARMGAVAAAEAPATTVDLGVTISPEGKLVSMGGMDPALLGVALPALDISLLQTLGMNQLDARVTSTGLTLIANNEELATMTWDAKQIEAVPVLYTKLTGAELPAQAESVLAVAEGWLADSQINLTAFVAEQPKEERPHLALGRPLAVQILKDGNLSVEGFAVRTGFEATIAQYEGLLGPVAVSWNGEQGRLTPVVGDMVMPSLSVDPGFLTTAMGSLLGETMDWNLIAESLSFADVSLTLASEGAKAPDAALLGYEQHPAPATFVATSAVKISRSTGDIAVLGTTLPLGFVEGLTGLEITNVVTQQVSPFEGVESLGVRLGPNGLAITVNGQRAMLAWDEQTRDNLVALAVKLFVDSYQGPAPTGGLLQDPVATLMAALKKADLGALQDAVAALNQGEVGFSVSLQEGALPESSWAGTLAGLQPLLDRVAPPAS